ncbi:MAG: acyltransferase [Clostridia bacterium]|nr:acyltransferase [Clostridia bacterium]
MEKRIIYAKQEAVMTRGLAILAMVCLHLFCRLAPGLPYQPVIWLSETKPLVYWLGFFGEICVPIYSLCAGYAQFLLLQKNKTHFRDNGRRILKLMKNYWIILALFCLLGLFFDKSGSVPGSWSDFIKSIFLLHSYTKTWWFLNTYIILLLIPSFIVMFPVKKINSWLGIILCFGLYAFWYVWAHMWDEGISFNNPAVSFIYTEIKNIFQVLPFFWIGAFLCKADIFEKINTLFEKIGKPKLINLVLIALTLIMFVLANIIEKGILMGPVGVLAFFSFVTIRKPKCVQKAFLFFGKHSTNTWLVHWFFYVVVFQGLVWKAKYPLLCLAFMLVLCIAASYLEMAIDKGLSKLYVIVRSQRRISKKQKSS